MDPSGSNAFRPVPQPVMELKHYQGYSVSTVPLDFPPPGFPPLGRPEPIVVQPQPEPDQRQEADEEEDGSDCETVDMELEKMLARPPAVPAPCQLAKFHHMLKVGVFVATIEMLTDNADVPRETIRANALVKWKELTRCAGQVETEPRRALCGSARIHRDFRYMASHIPYFHDLINKFVEEFDGTPVRVKKLRQATGFIKGLMAREGYPVFNITEKQNITEFSDMLDIFKVNALLFLEYLKEFKSTPYR